MSKNRQFTAAEFPSSAQLSNELERSRYRRSSAVVLRSILYTLITAAAILVIAAAFFLPILRIYGSSMNPTLTDGDIIVTMQSGEYKPGDIIAFYCNDKVLTKRVIANTGDWVAIDKEGNVSVNGEVLRERYVTDKAFGETNIDLPYQVPENRVFVLGDNRSISVDSRNTSVGCVAEEQIVGKAAFRIWPLSRLGKT